MTSLASLWLPILVSSVAIFVASAIIHMVIPWHKGDYRKLANESAVMDALHPLGLTPGDYIMPRANSTEEMKSKEYQEKRERGPSMIMTVLPKDTGMGRMFVLWFGYNVVVSVIAACVTTSAVRDTPHNHAIFHFSAITAALSYSMALWPLSIWFYRSWRITLTGTLDGVIYGLITGGVFVWLWPM